jgi:hypothetical protein
LGRVAKPSASANLKVNGHFDLVGPLRNRKSESSLEVVLCELNRHFDVPSRLTRRWSTIMLANAAGTIICLILRAEGRK